MNLNANANASANINANANATNLSKKTDAIQEPFDCD